MPQKQKSISLKTFARKEWSLSLKTCWVDDSMSETSKNKPHVFPTPAFSERGCPNRARFAILVAWYRPHFGPEARNAKERQNIGFGLFQKIGKIAERWEKWPKNGKHLGFGAISHFWSIFPIFFFLFSGGGQTLYFSYFFQFQAGGPK